MKAKIELAIDEAVRITESYVIEFFDSSADERLNRINDLKEKLGGIKKKRGGKRKGAGRPKLNKSQKKEQTKVIRVPISKLDAVKRMITSK